MEKSLRLSHNCTLEDLLRVDPIGSMYEVQRKEIAAFNAAHPKELEVFQNVMSATGVLWKKDPAFREAVKKGAYSLGNKNGRKQRAKLIGLSEEDCAEANAFQQEFKRALKGVTPRKALIRSWRTLKTRVGIADLSHQHFVGMLARPMLVLYSADWCLPCRIMRPTFGRLVPFFDKADVYYCSDDVWRRANGVEFIPQFVAYFPNGTSVSAHVGGTTQEVWDTMNNLITLGQNFSGKGTLVCTDDTCAIEPIAET